MKGRGMLLGWITGIALAIACVTTYSIGWSDTIRCIERSHVWQISACDRFLEDKSLDQVSRAKGLIARSSARYAKGDHHIALTDVERAISLSPDSKSAHTLRAKILAVLGRHADSVDAWLRVLGQDPEQKEALQYVAAACMEEKRPSPEKALTACDALLAVRSDSSGYLRIGEKAKLLNRYEILERRAVLRERAGNIDGALADLDETIKIRSLTYYARMQRAELLQRAGRREAAIAAYEDVLRQKGDFYPLPKMRKKANEQLANLIPPVHISSGVIWQKRNIRPLAPLRIVARSGSNFYIKVLDAISNEQVMLIYVPSGGTVDAKMPLGNYKVRYAAGQTWFGEKRLFGAGTSYAELDSQFLFQQTASGYSGFTVELIARQGGNLREVGIDADRF